jgi:hypothetical protein
MRTEKSEQSSAKNQLSQLPPSRLGVVKKSPIPVIPSGARNLHLLVFMGIMQMLRFAQHDSLISSQLLGERVSGDGVFSSRRRTGEGSLPRHKRLRIRIVRDPMP